MEELTKVQKMVRTLKQLFAKELSKKSLQDKVQWITDNTGDSVALFLEFTNKKGDEMRAFAVFFGKTRWNIGLPSRRGGGPRFSLKYSADIINNLENNPDVLQGVREVVESIDKEINGYNGYSF